MLIERALHKESHGIPMVGIGFMAEGKQIAWEPALNKLGRDGLLTSDDRLAIAALKMKLCDLDCGTDLVREGEEPDQCWFLLSGYVSRYKLTENGSRQMISIHLPGDILGLQQILVSRSDHSVQTLSAVRAGMVSLRQLKDLARTRPNIMEAFWRDCLVDASTIREWIVNVGRRDALERVAHLLCEFGTRSEAVGLSQDGKFDLPMTQEQLADATGLSSVHVNRVLQRIAARGLIQRKLRSVHVLDWPGLKILAGFREGYLH
jgi:CRP-like cAMP-binding protein